METKLTHHRGLCLHSESQNLWWSVVLYFSPILAQVQGEVSSL